MKPGIINTAFILAALFAVGSFAQSDPMNLIKAIDEFYKSIEENNIEKRISLLADDFILMPNNGKLLQDKNQFAEWLRGETNTVFKIKDLQQIDFVVEGSTGYTVNEYFYTYHKKGDEPVWHKTKNVHIWEKDAGGEWKLKVDIWNSSGE